MKKLKLHELGRISTHDYKEAKKMSVVLLLDNVRSLHNVGSAFRTADAFRIEKIYLTGITGRPPHREIQKTALGATESVEWEYVEEGASAVASLKSNGYQIIIVEQTTESISLNELNPITDCKYCLVFGNEVDGVSESIITQGDMAVEIPQSGTKHSLNIAVCVGIVAWHFSQHMAVADN